MQRPVVDLPQPDSPTSPKVSPCRMLKLTSSTALTVSPPAPNNPPPAGKYFFRFLTSTKLPLLLCILSSLESETTNHQQLFSREITIPINTAIDRGDSRAAEPLQPF